MKAEATRSSVDGGRRDEITFFLFSHTKRREEGHARPMMFEEARRGKAKGKEQGGREKRERQRRKTR